MSLVLWDVLATHRRLGHGGKLQLNNFDLKPDTRTVLVHASVYSQIIVTSPNNERPLSACCTSARKPFLVRRDETTP